MNYKKIRKVIIAVCLVASVIISFVRYIERRNYTETVGPSSITDNYVEFIDVGQGDSALIASKGKYCLIDTGDKQGFSAIRRTLREKNIKTIDVLIISHYHADHTGGLYDIVKEFDVENLIYPATAKDTNISNDVLYAKKECLANDGEFYNAKAGQTINLGDFKLTVLYQSTNLSEENNRSIYLMAKINNKKFLFTGDGEVNEERQLLKQNLDIYCDVLKVAHHGGSTSTSNEFLNECDPRFAVISCGENNMYGHPHKETLDRLNSKRVKTYTTTKNGNVIFSVDGNKISVNTEK